jgi:hypothetical protein
MMGITHEQAASIHGMDLIDHDPRTADIANTLGIQDSVIEDVRKIRWNFRGLDFRIGHDRINRMSMLVCMEYSLNDWKPENYLEGCVKSLLTNGCYHLMDEPMVLNRLEETLVQMVSNRLEEIMGSSRNCDEFNNMFGQCLQDLARYQILAFRIIMFFAVVAMVLFLLFLYWWKGGAMATIHAIYDSVVPSECQDNISVGVASVRSVATRVRYMFLFMKALVKFFFKWVLGMAS